MSAPSRVLARLAGLILRLGPPAFRRHYARSIERELLSLLDDARRHRGRVPMLRLWLHSLADLLGTVAREWRGPMASRGRGPLTGLAEDVKVAARAARRTPVLSATIVAMLGMGLALASVIFAFSDGYLFRSLAVAEPDRLFVVRASGGPGAMLSAAEAEGLRRSAVGHLGFVEGHRAARVPSGTLDIDGRQVRVSVDGLSEGFGAIVGLPLAMGRPFTAREHVDVEPVPIWLTHRFWRSAFGADPGVLGRRATVSSGDRRVAVEVVGVTDARITTFDDNFGPYIQLPDLFAPAPPRGRPSSRTLALPLVRLPPDLSRAQAEAAIGTALQGIAPAAPGATRSVRLAAPLGEQVAAGRPTARAFLFGGLLALGLVTINLVHLLLARGAMRQQEMATRAALGATRWRLARLFLVDGGLYGVAGIGVGLPVAWWWAAAVAASLPTRGSEAGTLGVVAMTFDSRAVLVAIALGLSLALAGGALPAWRILRRPLMVRTGGTHVPVRVSQAILASEVAVSAVVLVGVVFTGIGIWRFLHQPLGVDLDDRFRLRVQPAVVSGPAPDAERVRRALAALPGVRAVATDFEFINDPITVEAVPFDEERAIALGVGVAYFEAVGHQLVAGRFPTGRELSAAARVAVVDRSFAAAAWPATDAVGRVVRVGDVVHDVVGVVADRRMSLTVRTPAVVLVARRPPARTGAFQIWAPGASESVLGGRAARVVESIAPAARSTLTVVTLDNTFGDDVSGARFQTPILAVLGGYSCLLAGVGLFGLVAYLIAQRMREYGLRVALGARPADIRGHVLRQGVQPALVGLLVGLPAATALERVARASMSGWESSGPLALGTVGAAMVIVAVGASATAGRRALRVDPAVTLRCE